MTLATMANNISRFAPGLHPELVKSLIQTSYQHLCTKEWRQLNLQRQFYTSAIYSTGTVGVAADGVVTGVGTTFASAMVGRFMKVYYDDAFFEILSYASPTSITLKDWTGEVVSAGKTYSIFKTIYTMNSLFRVITDVVYQTSLSKKSQYHFNQIDPGRSSTSDTPTMWAYAGMASGVILVEIYPVPTDVVPLRAYGKSGYSTLTDATSPILPEDLIEAHALIAAYQVKMRDQPDVGWETLFKNQLITYSDLLESYLDEDYQLEEHPSRVEEKVVGGGVPTDDNFALDHDIEGEVI